jgi:hypothetical protein
VDLTSGVAVRLAALCLQDNGRLRDFAIWDVAARGALLVDLARAARLTNEPDGIVVDSTSTGFAPADRLLDAIAVEPEQSLDWWLDRGGVGMQDVADACVSSGRWTVERALLGRRYADRSPVAEGDRRIDLHRPDPDRDPDTAAVIALAIACGARGWPEPVGDAELAPTGPLRWVCEAVTDHLVRAHRHNLRAAGAADGGFSPYV